MENQITGASAQIPPAQGLELTTRPHAPSKGRRNRNRVSARRDGNNVKFRTDQNRIHATSEIEKQLEQLSIGVSRPPRYIPISLFGLVLITKIAYERSVYSMNSRARSCRISASEVLMCVMTLAYVKMALLHNKRRPLFGRVSIDDHLIQRVAGCVNQLPQPITCWMQNFGFFELDRNQCVPVADHTRVYTLWPVRDFLFPDLIQRLRCDGMWFDEDYELDMYRRVVFRFNQRDELALPVLQNYGDDDAYENIDDSRDQAEFVHPPPMYDPRSPDHYTSVGTPAKRPRPRSPSGSAGPPPPNAMPGTAAPPPLPNPVGPPGPLPWFPGSDVWLRFMIWCENWGPKASAHDLQQLAGSAAQMVHSVGPVDFQIPRCYRTSHDINERLFNIGSAMGYGYMNQTNAPVRMVAARAGTSDDCAMYVNAVPIALINAMM